MSSYTAPVGIFSRKTRRHVFTLAVVAACAAITLLLIGARPHQAPEATPIAQDATPRTAAEREWNEKEDLKASRYVGQPGIY